MDGVCDGKGRVGATIPYYFSFDETLNVGVDLGTPVSPEYPRLDNALTGLVHEVRIDLGEDQSGQSSGAYQRVLGASSSSRR